MNEKPQNPQDSNDQRSQPQRIVNIYEGNYNENIGGDYIQGSVSKILEKWLSKLLGLDSEAESDRILSKLLPIVRTEVIGRLNDVLRQDSLLQINHYLKLSFEDRGEEVGRDKLSKVISLPPQTNIIEVF